MASLVEALSALCAVLYVGGLITAAGYDVASYRIPNRTVAVVAVAAALALMLRRPDLATVAEHFAVALAVLVVGAGLFALRIWGAGDAKLLAAASLATGTGGLWLLVFWTAMVGGVAAALLLVLRRLPFLNRTRLKPWCRGLLSPEGAVPYGVAIASAGIGAFIGHHTVLTVGILGH